MSLLAVVYVTAALLLVALYVWYMHLEDLPTLYRELRESGKARLVAFALTAAALIAGLLIVEVIP